MGIGTLVRYLIGDRTAILTLSQHPRAWLLGLVFVLSAGFAREYDGEDLLHNPWYLLLPLAASLASSFLLFCVLDLPGAVTGSSGQPFWSSYRAFLGLFWLTAPLAWLYAVPYERLLDPVSAVHANLATLAVVSAWRVALMVRVAIVLMGMSPATALFRVLAYADGVALIAIQLLPVPIVEVMGGVHLTEAESAVRGVASFVCCWGSCSLPIWLVLALSFSGKMCWAFPDESDVSARHVSWPLGIMAFLSLAIWIGILPFTQSKQQARRQVETAFRERRLADALAIMSAHDVDDFPPHWDPPPKAGRHSTLLFDIWNEILQNDPAPWVRERYLQKFKEYLRQSSGPPPVFSLDAEKSADLINRMPEGPALLREIAEDTGLMGHLEPHLRPELRKKNQTESK